MFINCCVNPACKKGYLQKSNGYKGQCVYCHADIVRAWIDNKSEDELIEQRERQIPGGLEKED